MYISPYILLVIALGAAMVPVIMFGLRTFLILIDVADSERLPPPGL